MVGAAGSFDSPSAAGSFDSPSVAGSFDSLSAPLPLNKDLLNSMTSNVNGEEESEISS